MPVRSVDSQANDKNTLIPSHPCVVCACGIIASGKSTTIIDLMSDKNKWKGKYSRVVLASPTIEYDDKVRILVDMEDMCVSNQALEDAIFEQVTSILNEDAIRPVLPKYHGIDPEDLHTSYSPQIIQDIIDHQGYIIKTYGKELSDRVLIIFEDAVGLACFSRSHKDTFNKFVTMLRHYNCSVLVAVQKFNTVSPLIRTNFTGGFFWELSEIELKSVYESFSCGLPFHRWCEYVNVITSKPYNFIQFNRKNKRGHRVIANFDEFIA